jgi:hypothetical protein
VCAIVVSRRDPGYTLRVSLAEIKSAVDALSPEKLAELAVFIRERDEAAWDRQIDRDFTEDGGLHRVAEERFARTFARVACRICRDRQNAPDIWKHFDELL